ncbi:YtfJ family protein [[Haemophilus] felis]|nr:YtfJ family protein [[Haemophilus] felis]
MKKLTLFCAISSAFFASNSLAHNVQLNNSLPAVQVTDNGEMLLNNGEIHYQAWQSEKLTGKVRVLHHFAGRSSVKEKNEPLMNAIREAKFNPEKYQTTSIINANDVVFGTGGFVKSKAESGKKENAHSQVILDKQESVKNAWQLKEKESLIVVLDATGKVRFVQEGALNQQEVQQVVKLVTELTK